MKKKILTISMLLLAICMLFALTNTVKATDKAAKIGETEYDTLDNALAAAEDNAVITLQRDITIGSTGNQGQPEDEGQGYVVIATGKTVTLDMNGKSITSGYAEASTFRVENGSTITIKNSQPTGGTIKHTGEKLAVLIKKGTVTLESGVTVKTANQTKPSSAIQIGIPEGTDSAKLILNGAKVEGNKNGVSLAGSNSSLDVKSGKVLAKDFAICGNGSQTSNSYINITGGTMSSENTAAIYHPQTGTLNISGGTITGKFGIVARQGNIRVTGGKIVANGTVGDTDTVGDNETELPFGTGLIVDNSTGGYDARATATVLGKAQFETTGEPVDSFGNEENADNAISIGAGPVFNNDVDSAYLDDGLVQGLNGEVMTEEDYQESLKPQDEPTNEPTDEPADDKDDTPKTGSVDVALITSVVAMISVAGIVAVKRYSK